MKDDVPLCSDVYKYYHDFDIGIEMKRKIKSRKMNSKLWIKSQVR